MPQCASQRPSNTASSGDLQLIASGRSLVNALPRRGLPAAKKSKGSYDHENT